ncbi:MAG: hypothetical protein JO191_03330 [Mycobacteriaceae bacterium]|nr:hypothetical protein [Mycobacteriaceae bacterium]
MSLRCRYCRDGLEHCHGTVIMHAHRRAECTEDDCDGPSYIDHVWRVDCDAVGCTCGQVTAVAV